MSDGADGGVELDFVGADFFDELGNLADAVIISIDTEAEEDFQPDLAGVFVAKTAKPLYEGGKTEVGMGVVDAAEGFFVAGVQ